MKQKSRWQMLRALIVEDPNILYLALAGAGTLASVLLSIFVGDIAISSAAVLAGLCSLAFYALGIAFFISKHRRTVVNILSKKQLPVVIVTGKGRRDARQQLEVAKETINVGTGFKEFKQLQDFFNVNLEDLLITSDDNLNPNDPHQWKDFIDKIQREIRQFSDRIAGEKVYHVFVFGIGLTSLAVGLGAVFGTRSKAIIYQLSDDKWEPVLDLSENVRRIKEVRTDASYRYISVSLPQQFAPEVALVLNLSSHPATGYVQNYLQTKNLSHLTLVEVNNTYGGNLQEKDWTHLVQEVFSVYSQIHKQGPTRIHLFANMPTALAFGLGVAFGIYNQIVVYVWDTTSTTYCPVFSLNELESLL